MKTHQKKTKKITVIFTVLFCSLFLFSGCYKKIVYSKDRRMEPVSQDYNESVDATFKACVEVLKDRGYAIEEADEEKHTIRTKWRSTKATSHYIDMFDREDYGTVGAYYRILARVEPQGARALVTLEAPVRSVVSRIHSSHREEKKILKKISDHVRHEDFEMSNVGVKE